VWPCGPSCPRITHHRASCPSMESDCHELGYVFQRSSSTPATTRPSFSSAATTLAFSTTKMDQWSPHATSLPSMAGIFSLTRPLGSTPGVDISISWSAMKPYHLSGLRWLLILAPLNTHSPTMSILRISRHMEVKLHWRRSERDLLMLVILWPCGHPLLHSLWDNYAVQERWRHGLGAGARPSRPNVRLEVSLDDDLVLRFPGTVSI
jgi:hypothetical protein